MPANRKLNNPVNTKARHNTHKNPPLLFYKFKITF